MKTMLTSFILCLLAGMLQAQELKPFMGENKKYGYKDADDKIVIQPTYSYAQEFSEGLAYVETDLKSGFIDEMGKVVVPLIYDPIYEKGFAGGFAKVRLSGKYGCVNRQGKLVIAAKYTDIRNCNGVFAAQQKEREAYALLDSNGKKLTPFKYHDVTSVSRDMVSATWYPKTGKILSYVLKTGKELKYTSVSAFYDSFAAVGYGRKYGFIDKTGKEVIPMIYDDAQSFSEGLALVKTKDSSFFIDQTGQKAFSLASDIYPIGLFSNGYVPFIGTGGHGYLDRTGKITAKAIFKEADGFINGFARVVDKNNIAYRIDTNFNYQGTNNSIIPTEWIKSANGKYSLVRASKVIVAPKYDGAFKYDDGYSSVKMGNKAGIVDAEGKECVPPKYDVLYYYNTDDNKKKLLGEGFFMAKRDGKFCYVDVTGKELPNRYDDARHFYKGLALVRPIGGKTDSWNYIDKLGKMINEAQGTLVQSFNTDIGTLEVYSSFYKDTFKGVGLRKGNKILIYPHYDSITYYKGVVTNHNGVITCKKGGIVRNISVNNLAMPAPADITVQEKAQIACQWCSGKGVYYTSVTTKGSMRAVTEYKTVTSYETRWNPKTNSNEGYSVKKSVPITKYERQPDVVAQTSHKCTSCAGKGTVNGTNNIHLVWNAPNYYYDEK